MEPELLAVFDAFWSSIDQYYAFFDRRGDPPGSIDWEEVRRVHRPRVAALTTEDELFELLHELVVSSGAPHTEPAMKRLSSLRRVAVDRTGDVCP